MNCREAEKNILVGRDSELAEDQRAALASHLSECAACRRIHDDLTASVEGWRARHEEVRVPDANLEWQKLRRTIARPPLAERRSWPSWLALPAAGLAAAAVAIGVYIGTPSNPPASARTVTPSSVAAAAAPTDNSVPTPVTAPMPAAAVVFVDDKSGWTFVWDGDSGQRI